MHIIFYCDNHDALPDNESEFIFSMFNVVNRSIAFHNIEQLCKVFEYFENTTCNSLNKITFITNNNPSLLRVYLGNGARWGCEVEVISIIDTIKTTVDCIRYANFLHGIKDDILFFPNYVIYNPQDFYDVIKKLIDSNRSLTKIQDDISVPVVALLYIAELGFKYEVRVDHCDITSVDKVYNANIEALSGAYSWLLRHGLASGVFSNNRYNEASIENVFIGRNCYIGDDVNLFPPIYIGDNCRIENGCEIGPYVSIGTTCIIDNDAKVKKSIVHDYTYIAPLISIKNAYVMHDNIHQIKSDLCVLSPSMLVQGHSKIGNVHHRNEKKNIFKSLFCSFVFKAVIACVFLFCIPLIFVQWLLGRCQFEKIVSSNFDESKNIQCNTSFERINTVFWRAHRSCPAYLRSAIIQYLPSLLLVLLGRVPLLGKEIWVKNVEMPPLLSKTRDSSLRRLKKGLLPPYLGLGRLPMSNIEKAIHIHWYAKKANACLDLKIIKGVFAHSFNHWAQKFRNK